MLPSPVSDDQWQVRLRLQSEEWSRRRAARLAVRRQHTQRRAHGMIDRNAARLAEARRRARSERDPPAPRTD
jgi:hypothetical protein